MNDITPIIGLDGRALDAKTRNLYRVSSPEPPRPPRRKEAVAAQQERLGAPTSQPKANASPCVRAM
jgi:hypothetical protein